MAAVSWPTLLDYLVERDNFSLDPHDDNTRTDFDQGPARVRQRFTTSRALFTVSWIMTAYEMSLFQAFYKHDLNNGTSWFNLPVYSPDNYVSREARFSSKYSAKVYGAFDWTISATIELRELPIISEATWYLIQLMGSVPPIESVLTDPLQPWVNVEYPSETSNSIWATMHTHFVD